MDEVALAIQRAIEKDCKGVDAKAFVRKLSTAFEEADNSLAVERAMRLHARVDNRPPVIGYIVNENPTGGIGGAKFSRLHWQTLLLFVGGFAVSAATSPWSMGVLLFACTVPAFRKLAIPITGLEKQVIYEACLSLNNSQSHEIGFDALYNNLMSSRSQAEVTVPAADRSAFDAALAELISVGLLAKNKAGDKVRLNEWVVPDRDRWL